MDEKQMKQIEIVKKALSGHNAALCYIHDEILELAQSLLEDVTAFEVLLGKSDLMLAASALLSIAQQVESIIPDKNENQS